MVFEQTYRSIDDDLWKETGCSSDLDYVNQTSWLLLAKKIIQYGDINNAVSELGNASAIGQVFSGFQKYL